MFSPQQGGGQDVGLQFQQQFPPLQQPPFFQQQQFNQQPPFFTSSSSSSFTRETNTFTINQPEFLSFVPPCRTQSGENGRCRPLTQCVNFYAEVPELRRQPCKLNEVEFGVCCPLRQHIGNYTLYI